MESTKQEPHRFKRKHRNKGDCKRPKSTLKDVLFKTNQFDKPN